MSHKVILKKYPNRRLYDTENSTYVILRDVADMIKQGKEVEVIDVRSNEDVTAPILAQIIMEQVKKNNRILPVSLLHLIIRFGDDVLRDFFENHLEKAIQSYLLYKRNMSEQFKIYLELGMDFSKVAKKSMEDLSPFHSLFEESSKKNKDKDKE